jgi:TrmH family RNA methyltransferase
MSRINYISSIDNKHVRLVRKIISNPKKYSNYVVVEGEKCVKEFLGSSLFSLLQVFSVSEKSEIIRFVGDSFVSLISEKVFYYMSDVENGQGVIGLFTVNYNLIDRTNLINVDSTFILDGLSDPGNVGTLIRTAAALGKGVIIMVGGVYPFSQKVIRSSAGMIAHVRIVYFYEYDEISKAFLNKTKSVVMDMGGQIMNPLISQQYRNEWSIVLGNEGSGVSAFWKKHSHKIALPMDRRVESLNVAIAGSVIGYFVWGESV